MIKRCSICHTTALPVITYRCTGVDLGESVDETINLCDCCCANIDDEWLAEHFDWCWLTSMEVLEK